MDTPRDLGYHLNKQRDACLEQALRFFTAVESDAIRRAEKRADERVAKAAELQNKYWNENIELKNLLRDVLVEFSEEISTQPDLYDRVKSMAAEIVF